MVSLRHFADDAHTRIGRVLIIENAGELTGLESANLLSCKLNRRNSKVQNTRDYAHISSWLSSLKLTSRDARNIYPSTFRRRGYLTKKASRYAKALRASRLRGATRRENLETRSR